MSKYKRNRNNKKKITLKAYAKINLSLDVIEKRPDGYHEVDMVMQAIELYDKVTVEQEKSGVAVGSSIAVTTNLPYLPINQDNIAYKAAALMKNTYKPDVDMKITIHLEKHIPVAAGLAGGSANGAAVLRGLAKLWGLSLSLGELCRLGESLGADVPFCLWAQEGLTCARAKGLGTELSPLPPVDCLVLLSKPPISVSTARVYGGLSLPDIPQEAHPDTEALIYGLSRITQKDQIEQRNRTGEEAVAVEFLAPHMKNLLETVTLGEFTRVSNTKEKLLQLGSSPAVLMSGSGPTVFALYDLKDEAVAREAYRRMKQVNRETHLRRTWLG